MGRLKEWARTKNRELHRQAMEDRDSHLWHSGSYHRYFEGYTEYKELDSRGKERIHRVYTGTTYIQNLEKPQYILLRVLYLIIAAAMAGMVILAERGQVKAGTAFYVAIPELITLCLLAWLLYTLVVNYLFLPKRMTVHDYSASSGTLQRITTILQFAFAADALMCALEALLSGMDRYQHFGLTVAAFCGGALFALVMNQVEKRVSYLEEENTKELSKADCVIIGDATV